MSAYQKPMRPGSEGFEDEIDAMAALGFKWTVWGNFEHEDDALIVDWRYECWTARCTHIHDGEREEGHAGRTPMEAARALVNELDFFDDFARRVTRTAETLRGLRKKMWLKEEP